MEQIKQTHTEVEVGTQFVFNAEPSAPNVVLAGLGRVVDAAKLEVRMLAFDALHGTNYRAIRHDLVEKEKRARFEQSIGLVITGRKK
jgi:hypothetical protein